MKEPSVIWILHLFSSETTLTEIIKYIINCKLNSYFKVLKFFDLAAA